MAKTSIWPFLRKQQAMVPVSHRSGGDQLPASTLTGPCWGPPCFLPLPPLQVALAAKSEGEHASRIQRLAFIFRKWSHKIELESEGFFIITSSNREGGFLEKEMLTLVAVYCLQSKTLSCWSSLKWGKVTADPNDQLKARGQCSFFSFHRSSFSRTVKTVPQCEPSFFVSIIRKQSCIAVG